LNNHNVIISHVYAEEDSTTCAAKGFDRETLLCGTCSRIGEILGKVVENECLSCCTNPYDKVTLIASQYAMMKNGGLNEFVTQRHTKFARKLIQMEMTQETAENAQLILSSSTDHGNQQIVRVTQWSANDLEDFLAQYFPRVN
jgi:hypothetical protein